MPPTWRCSETSQRFSGRHWQRACTSEDCVSTLDRLCSSARCGLGCGTQSNTAIGARNSPTFRCPDFSLRLGARYACSLLVALGRVIGSKRSQNRRRRHGQTHMAKPSQLRLTRSAVALKPTNRRHESENKNYSHCCRRSSALVSFSLTALASSVSFASPVAAMVMVGSIATTTARLSSPS